MRSDGFQGRKAASLALPLAPRIGRISFRVGNNVRIVRDITVQCLLLIITRSVMATLTRRQLFLEYCLEKEPTTTTAIAAFFPFLTEADARGLGPLS